MKQVGRTVESISAGASRGKTNSAEAVLVELARLLEEYGPAWYTEEQHERVCAALGSDPARAFARSRAMTR